MSGGAAGGFVAAVVGRTPPVGDGAPAARPAGHPEPAAPRGWRLALAAGVFPPLLLGFTASALANRLAFVGWALVVAVGHTLLLRASWGRGWPASGRLALVAGWAALGMAAFAGLVESHGEILDLGYRALLWAVYTPLLTRPSSWQALAVVLALVAATAAGRARLAARRDPS